MGVLEGFRPVILRHAGTGGGSDIEAHRHDHYIAQEDEKDLAGMNVNQRVKQKPAVITHIQNLADTAGGIGGNAREHVGEVLANINPLFSMKYRISTRDIHF